MKTNRSKYRFPSKNQILAPDPPVEEEISASNRFQIVLTMIVFVFPGFPDDKFEAITASGELGYIGQAERLEILLSLEFRQEKYKIISKTHKTCISFEIYSIFHCNSS